MTEQRPDDDERPTDDEPRVPGAGDDERETREHISQTGEPKTDALGNADGAS